MNINITKAIAIMQGIMKYVSHHAVVLIIARFQNRRMKMVRWILPISAYIHNQQKIATDKKTVFPCTTYYTTYTFIQYTPFYWTSSNVANGTL